MYQGQISYTKDIITLARLENAKYFSHLDTNSGFHRIKLTEKIKSLTSIITPFSDFKCIRLPFGITCALDYFSKMFNESMTFQI